MTSSNRKQFHERLWSAAVQLRANSGLKLNQIAEAIQLSKDSFKYLYKDIKLI